MSIGLNPDFQVNFAGEPQQDLGQFAAGAIPPSIENLYTDFDDAVVDLTGFTTLVTRIDGPSGASLTPGTPVVKGGDPTLGTLIYTFTATDMLVPGFYRLQMWASNGTIKLESDVFTYEVYDGPGAGAP